MADASGRVWPRAFHLGYCFSALNHTAARALRSSLYAGCAAPDFNVPNSAGSDDVVPSGNRVEFMPLPLSMPEADLLDLTVIFGACLDSLVLWLDGFCRSFFLLYLMAGMRLLLRALALRRSSPQVNGRIRFSPVAPAGLATRDEVLPVGNDRAGRTAACFSAPRRPDFFEQRLSASGAAFDLDGHTSVSPSSPKFSRQRVLGWEVPVLILRFQMASAYVVLHTADVVNADDLAEQVEDRWDAFDLGLCCIPVHPQPSMDMPVLLTAPMRFALLDRIPVCIQVQDGDGDCLCWQEFLDPAMTIADIKDALGNQWPPHSKVYVRDSARAAGAGPVRLVAGDLLRIVRPGASVPAVVPIQVKLERPDLHFRRLDVDGYPDTQTVSGRECLLQPLCPVRLVMYSPVPGPSIFEDVMLSHADRSLGELRLVWPRQDIANLRIVGFPVRNVVGTFPAHNTRRVPIFADTREVGFSLRVPVTRAVCLCMSSLKPLGCLCLTCTSWMSQGLWFLIGLRPPSLFRKGTSSF